MRRWYCGFAATLVVVAASVFPTEARALLIAPPAGPQRVINANAVIVGKVIGLEPQDTTVMNVTYRIAVVKVDQALRGLKDAKQVRVAFIPPPANPPKFKIGGGNRNVQLAVGNAGMFILTKHPKEDFYMFGGPVGYFISSENNKGFDGDVEAVKTIIKVAPNPQAGLKSKDAEERLIAAALLVEKYRMFRGPGAPKEEPIDAAESKQILLALADADWKQAAFGSLRPNPGMLFGRLGINQADGFTVPPGGNYQPMAQNWLRDNADKYRVKRFVGGDAK